MTATYKNAKHLCERRPAVDKKVIHIVVHDGLIQSIYAENVTIDNVVIYDLDTEDNEEYDELSEAVGKLPDIAYRVY